MKKVILFLFVITLLVQCGGGNSQQIIEWEYKVEAVPDVSFDTSMNKLGSEQWELVFARRAQSDGEFAYEMIFKRPKIEKKKSDEKK